MKRKINEWIDLDHAVSGGVPSAGRVHLLVGVPDPVDVFMSLISCWYLCDKVTILNIVFRPMTWRCCLLYVRLRPVGNVHTQLGLARVHGRARLTATCRAVTVPHGFEAVKCRAVYRKRP
jgi:hypothetical protein